MPDKTIICEDCKNPFTHSEGAQQFFQSKGFMQDPKRCSPCRKARKDGNYLKRKEDHKAS